MNKEQIVSVSEPVQLELFRDAPETFSNTIEIFDAIPKWEWRTRKTSVVETNIREFKLKNKVTGEEIVYEAEIVPAILGKRKKPNMPISQGAKKKL